MSKSLTITNDELIEYIPSCLFYPICSECRRTEFNCIIMDKCKDIKYDNACNKLCTLPIPFTFIVPLQVFCERNSAED